jgi:hypothetical protein
MLLVFRNDTYPQVFLLIAQELSNLCTESKELSNLSRSEMKKRVEKNTNGSVEATPVDMTPNGVTKFYAMLLAGAWEHL